MCKAKFVRIVWHDIASVASTWSTKHEVLEEAQKLYDTEYHTVGEVIHETPNYIVIASTVTDTEMYADVSMIMKSVIIRIEDFSNSKKRTT